MRGVTPIVAVLEELGADLHYTRGPASEDAQARTRGQISIGDVGQNWTGGDRIMVAEDLGGDRPAGP